ncbi:MAG: sulfurtransferase TusA family protein [Methylophilaceae bacterium]
MEFTKEIDARNLKCPLPILRCKKGLAEIQENEILKIVATDPGSIKDIEAFCKQTGHALARRDENNDEFIFYIKKRAN